MSSAPQPMFASRSSQVGPAWVALCLALGLHTADEALTGFLAIYNPTVLAMRSRWNWFPMPTFEFREWLVGLISAVVILLLLSPLFYRNVRWIRPLGYLAVIINILNALGHTAGTIMGRTVESVRFSRPAPGFYSSPLLLAASIWLLVELRRSRRT